MSSNIKSKNQPVELRRSARHSKSKSLDNQKRNSKTKSPGTKASPRGSSFQATPSIPNGSRSSSTKTAKPEVNAKRNGSFRRLRSIEKDGAKPMDVPNHDEEISPLRSNRVRFIIQSKRKQLPVRSESTAKRTKKHKENFDAFCEGDAKVVNSELDIKTNPALPINEKSSQDSSSSANEQSCDNSETLNGHTIIGDDTQTKCEPQTIDSDESSLSETAASCSSTPAEENLNEVSVNISLCSTTNEESKTSFMKSFDLRRVKVQTSCEVEECNELENEELESSEEVVQDQSSIKSTKESINESVENIEVNEDCIINIKEVQVDKASGKPALNKNIKNVKQEVNEDCDNNAKEESQGSNEKSRKKELNKNIKTTETELNRASPRSVKEELSEIEVSNVDQEMAEVTVERINQKINVNSAKNTKSNRICADGRQEANVEDKEQEVNENTAKYIKQEENENSVENIELELKKEMNEQPNESSIEQAEQEANQNWEKNLMCMKEEIATENAEQGENNKENAEQGENNKENAEQGENNKENAEQGENNKENAEQGENNKENAEQGENNKENAGPGINKNSIESMEVELNATSYSNTEEQGSAINAENIDQELNMNKTVNMEVEFNENSIETIEKEVNETMRNIKQKLDNNISIENIEQESIKQELNDSSMDSIDQLDRKHDDTLSEEQPCNVENSQELKSSEDKKCSYGFEPIDENICRFNRKNHKNRKQVRRLLCDCTWEEDDYLPGVLGCGEECLNRILMIECGARCRIGNKCSNKRFQKREYAKTETFQADSKGTGLKAAENVISGRFVIEFVGEVLNGPQFKQRVRQYARENTIHHYFMALSNDEIIDATQMGNLSRFINHSCDPNCETQKWTVNGELRVGFFAKCDIKDGEELTFDYKFQIYGREAQKCYCGTEKCKGYIGQVKPMLIDTISGGKSSSRRRKTTEEKRRGIFEDFSVEEEIEKLCENNCLKNREDTLLFARLMVRVEDVKIRLQLLDVLLKTTEQACLRMFVDYHGLSLIWSWMVDGTDLNLRYKILEVLFVLPVPNKTILIRSKVLKEVEKWCMPPPPPPSKEKVSENDEVEATVDDGEGTRHATELVELANKLLDTWKLLKEAFRIPRVEEQKKRVSNNETDNNAQFKDGSGGFSSPKVVDESKVSTEQTSTNKSKDDGRNKFNSAIEVIDTTYRSNKNLPLLGLGAKHTALSKTERRQLFAASMAQLYPFKQTKESTPENSWTPEMSNDECAASLQDRLSLIPTVGYTEPLPVPASQLSATNSFSPASQQLTNVPPPLMFHPPNITVPPPQLPFLGVPPPALPSVTSAAGPSAIPVRTSSSWMTDPTSSTSPATYGPPPVYPPPSSAMNCLTQPPPTIQPYQNAPPPTTGVPPFAPYTTCQSQPFHYPQAPNASPAMGQFTTQNFDPMPDADGYLTLRVKLPPDWKAAGDGQGNVYFYHTVTRKTQWHPPMFSIPELVEEEEVLVSTADEPQSYVEQSENCSTFEDQTQEEEEEEEEEDEEEVIVDDRDLPPNWKSAKDAEGHTYYYNVITRNTQWSPPSCEKSTKDVEEEDEDDDNGHVENIVDEDASSTPLMDEPQLSYPKKKMKKMLVQESPSQESTPSESATPTLDGTPTLEMPSQEADSSSGAKKIKDKFKAKLSALVIRCLNQYRKPSCEAGRITNITDFRYLARKLTHCLMFKELRHCKNIEDLHYSEIVRNKAHDYIEKYMNKYGPVYRNEKSQNEKNQDDS